MSPESKCIIVLCMAVLTLRPCFCEKVRMLKSNARVSAVTETHNTRSLVECAYLLENTPDSVSFNYKEDDNTCELSANYFDESATDVEGWKVYGMYEIVDGGWGDWMNWGTCSVTCGFGTRTRTRNCNNPSPSNGGRSCEGLSTENGECNECHVDGGWGDWMNWGTCSVTCQIGTRTRTRSCNHPSPSNGGRSCEGFSSDYEECNERDCYLDTDYTIGTNNKNWLDAADACEASSATLVIFDSLEEMDFVVSLLNDNMVYWIGMTCAHGGCTWEDGRDVADGFQVWHMAAPSQIECVTLYQGEWDGMNCSYEKMYICEL